MNIKLLSDRILLEVEGEVTTKSGLVISKDADQGEIQVGKVLSVGPGKPTEVLHSRLGIMKDSVPMNVKEGDRVMFQYGAKIEIEGVIYRLVREEDVILILT